MATGDRIKPGVYLSRIENGSANPTVSVVAALAATLNVKISALLEENEAPD